MKLVVSNLLLYGLENAPQEVRAVLSNVPTENIEHVTLDEEAIALANTYLQEGVVAENSIDDARHIALATIHRADLVLSWNYKHIVNINRIHLYNAVNMKLGYPLIDIRSPKEVIYEG